MKFVKTGAMKSAIAILGVLLVCMVILNIAHSEELSTARIRISAVYQKAFYETCELTEAISSNYRKLLVAGDEMQMQVLLGEISRQSQGAASNLALLPLGEETISATIKFINQAEDFAETLSTKLAAGEQADEGDYQAIQALCESADRFSAGLNQLLERFERGEAVFDAQDYQATGEESLYPLTSEAGQYPVLLYDGPFSDGAKIGNFEMVQTKEAITQAQAEEKLRAFIPVDKLIFTGESHPELDIYEFRVQSGEYLISAGVTRQGGEILYLLPENNVEAGEALQSPAQLTDIAQRFLTSRGYGDMEMSYFSSFGGILTINYAAVQDGVILYPDLVKLQLSMKDGRVIGLDARGYLQNHHVRNLPSAVLSPEEAMRHAGARLIPSSARLCLIPQNGEEHLCYEISATDGEGDFLVYIDAQNGAERDLMQVISRENGTLVM